MSINSVEDIFILWDTYCIMRGTVDVYNELLALSTSHLSPDVQNDDNKVAREAVSQL